MTAIFVAAMIETTIGVENAAAIAAVPGIDMLFIGPFDLSLSMGTFPDFGPKHEAAMQSVLQAAQEAGQELRPVHARRDAWRRIGGGRASRSWFWPMTRI